MESEATNSNESTKLTVWQYLFNFKVAVSASIVWVGLICQDFYVYVLNFTWISNWKLTDSSSYTINWLLTLLVLYFLFCLINYLVKLSSLQKLYNKKVACIVLSVWFLMNISCYHLLYFEYIISIVHNYVYVLKVTHLIALYALVLMIKNLIQRYQEKTIKHQLILATVFCTIGWIFLLLTYPGTWGQDDIWILNNAGLYRTTPWQHFFSGTYHILCLQTLPFVFSVPFFNVLLNALMYSYCIVKIANLFTKQEKSKIVLEILLALFFFFPSVLFYTLGGFRIGIYQFLVLYVLTKMISLYYDKKRKITILTLIEITFFTIIVGSWRTECFFFPFIILVMLLFFKKERIQRLVAFFTAIVAFAGVIYIGQINKKMINSHDYDVCATLQIIIPIIREVDNLDKDTLITLNKVINIDTIKTLNTDEIYLHVDAGVINLNYSTNDYKNYIKKIIELTLKYPDIAVNKMYKTFKNTAITEWIVFPVGHSIANFANSTDINYSYFTKNIINSSYLYKPFNMKLRNNVIKFINGLNSVDATKLEFWEPSIFHRLIYNLIIPIFLGITSFILVLFINKKFLLLSFGALIINFIIIFVTAPSGNFFYYLPIYLCLYVFSIPIIWNATAKLIEKIKNFRKK